LSGLAFVTEPVLVTEEGAGQVVEGTARDVAGNVSTRAVTVNLDKTPPAIQAMTPGEGETVGELRPVVRVDFQEILAGLDVGAALMMVDGVDVTALSTLTATNLSYTPQADLAEGTHSTFVYLRDRAGNVGWRAVYWAADTDQLPNSWESLYFGDLLQTGAGDPDVDGLNNLEEFLAGTDPTSGDTDLDHWSDQADEVPVSRFFFNGDSRFCVEDVYVYPAVPAWIGQVRKQGGTWESWHVAGDEPGEPTLNIQLDRGLMNTDLRMDLVFVDHAGMALTIELLSGDGEVVATVGEIEGQGTEELLNLTLTVPLAAHPDATTIRFSRLSGEVTLAQLVLYVDADFDGIDAPGETQLGTSDLLPDSDGDGFGDAEEQERSSDPTDSASVPQVEISGTVAYAGPQQGPILVKAAFASGGALIAPLSGPGPYTLSGAASPGAIVLSAWCDSNASGAPDFWEAQAGRALAGTANSYTEDLTLYDPDPDRAGLALYYSFGSAQTVVPDESGSGNTGVVHGARWVNDGVPAGSCDFNGSSDYISAGPPDGSLAIAGNQLTISAWLRRSPENVTCWFLGKMGPGTGSYGLYVQPPYVGPANKLVFTMDVGGGWGSGGAMSDLTVQNDDQWHHVAAVYDGASIVLYIDGAASTPVPCSGNIVPKANTLKLGWEDGWNSQRYKGKMDEVRVYNRALAPAEIALLHSSALAPQARLTIEGSPAPAGAASPLSYGLHHVLLGSVIANSVEEFAAGSDGVRYQCTGWTGAGDVPVSGDGRSVSFMVTQDSTLTWKWVPSEYRLSVAVGGNGGVYGALGAMDEGEGWFAVNSEATVTAIPAHGWHFVGWTGDVPAGDEMDNPLELTMDRPRSVKALFAGDIAGPTDGLVVCYTFNADSGGAVLDSSGNGNDGYLVGNVTYEDSIYGKAPRFTSRDTYIVSGGAGLNGNGWPGLTVSAWINKKAYTTYGTIFNRGSLIGTTAGTFLMNTRADWVGAQFGVLTNANGWVALESGAAPDLNVWYHYVGVYDGINLSFYIDGQLIAQVPVAIPNQPLYDEANNKLVIGNLAWEQGIHWYDMYFDGLIDEVRIYNRALSPGELAQLDAQPTLVGLSGQVTYTGPQAGDIHVVAVPSPESWALTHSALLADPGAYSIANLPANVNWWLKAWRDSSGDGLPDAWEAQGAFSDNPLMPADDMTGIDLPLTDPDLDGDEMPDYWELAHGLDPSDPSDSSADPD
ncbi:MAG: LamG-like jellyroll fold domain-containing protein, partial [Acidobacteriota bacterium]